ncbi:MAG: hypothetical protein LUC25_07250 [Ruminococcus sp.]|nr:hypothetical protein [Ruminococcus sp.]
MNGKFDKGFWTIMGALVLVVASVTLFVYRLMSNKAYYEKWKDYDECGLM